ncbi:MAG: phosphoglucomutase/phosphomannomutase family protein [Dehalococcoidia bacterium]|jgi:alpha-D-glucose phosphate-specific phosphoglucomutase|nr:phosphoglucomutase/phosphomannomutase family protein [Chloroflexota bacterium]MCK4242746.1 phosphoglucomutase/phosphomannomutase family protein [Dehalococcoidia bacterium]
MPGTIKFGTDGWRGIIAQDFTFDNVRLCAQGVANHVKAGGLAHRGLVIGYDTRFASEDFAAAAAEVVAANRIKVYLCQKITPIPIVAYAILMKKTAGAIIITASHNPAKWNGFKYRLEQAISAPPEVTAELERHIADITATGDVKHIPLDQGVRQGLVEMFDPSPSYLSHIGELVDVERLRHAGLKVIVDSMYGAGAGYFATILGGDATEVLEIHGERNPLFPGIQPEPIASHLTELSALVKERGASVGLATDGDADRIGIVDEKGTFITTLQVFALLALYLLELCGRRGAIVKTITSTSMLDRLGELFQVPVYETPVGFKHVAPRMIAENALIGGEESGGFAFRGHVPDRDGLLAGLYFLDLMVRAQKSPSQLLEYLYSKVGPHYYDRIDIQFPHEEREAIINRLAQSKPSAIDNLKLERVDTGDGFRFLLAGDAWLLIRFSGTEPIIRIYAEGDSRQRVSRLIAQGRKMAGV